MNANENMVAEPSVGRTEGRDDYAQYGLFHHFTCNFSVDENGFNHVDALEGQIGFTKYGKVQVGEVIGYVGHTGRVTGNHLHLEVRIDGNRADVLRYFTL